VTLDSSLSLVKVDIDLDSLPIAESKYNGYEVVAEFHVHNFNNGQTFYTDTNGLEMQERKLNYRPTWDLMDTNAHYGNQYENITWNYFPINSAISMKDINSDRVFSVMNDRAQGGSALKPGTIELMQNRQAPNDDCKGVGEPLQEKNEFGKGIRVPATYYVQISNEKTQGSLIRKAQQLQNSPAQIFFNFDSAPASVKVPVGGDYSGAIKQAGVSDNLKLYVVPMAKNKLHIRLENLEDLYDLNAKTYTVDMKDLLHSMWKEANKQAPVDFSSYAISEKSLTGNMDVSEMWARKIQWKTVDDAKLSKFSNRL